ncbi:hypothetical protein GWK74_04435 [Candidatus Saccharibacteria bacterium oral taxon 488]|nr:hypothetical protein GWK74_04435 [Candidatus Saccharibacteria bacterium oral taxon 488]
MSLLQLAVALIVGIITGVLGNAFYQWIRNMLASFTDRLDLKGVWGERVSGYGERLNSIGSIRYDLRRQMWVFDGTNFHNDGRPYCHWRTISSHVDRVAGRYYYIFLNTHEDSGHRGYTGFGFIELEKHGRTWSPVRGSFAAGNPGEAFRSHSVIRIDSVPNGIAERLEVFKFLEEKS